MKKHTFLLVGAVLASACVVGGLAQAPSGAPKPGPEHQKLAYFAGKWVSEGETKASAFGPAMKFSFVETCEWFSGGFAIVCHSEGKMGEGAVKGLSVMRSEEHTSELQSRQYLVCRLLLEKKK